MHRFSKLGTLFSCSLAVFLVWLDFAIVNTAIPAIQKELQASLLEMQWVMNAYIIAVAVLIVALGRISDYFGRLKMLVIGVFLFGLFSLFAGLATHPIFLIICRFMQGAATAAVVPTSVALISHVFHGDEKGWAFGIWGGLGGIGMAIGPVVGGILVSWLSWRWIFFINVPLSVISIFYLLYCVKDSKKEERAVPPDFIGVSLLIVCLFSFVFAIMHGPESGWISRKICFLLLLSTAAFVCFFLSEKKSKSPTIPFALFTHLGFLQGSLVMIGLVFVFSSVLFLVPLYLINVRGQEAYQAGLTLLPITGAIAIVSPITGRWMAKWSHNHIILLGMTLYLASLFFQIFIGSKTPYLWLLFCYLLLGLGWGIARTPATTVAIAAAPSEFGGTASGTLWTLQNISGSLGIAINLTLFRTISGDKYAADSFLVAYRSVLFILASVFLLIIILFLFLKRKQQKRKA